MYSRWMTRMRPVPHRRRLQSSLGRVATFTRVARFRRRAAHRGHDCLASARQQTVPSPRDVLGLQAGRRLHARRFPPAPRATSSGSTRRPTGCRLDVGGQVHRGQRDARRGHLVRGEPRAARSLPRHRAAAGARPRRQRRRGARAGARGQGGRLDRQRPARERGRDGAARDRARATASRPTTVAEMQAIRDNVILVLLPTHQPGRHEHGRRLVPPQRCARRTRTARCRGCTRSTSATTTTATATCRRRRRREVVNRLLLRGVAAADHVQPAPGHVAAADLRAAVSRSVQPQHRSADHARRRSGRRRDAGPLRARGQGRRHLALRSSRPGTTARSARRSYFHNIIGILTETGHASATPYTYDRRGFPATLSNGVPTLVPSVDLPEPVEGRHAAPARRRRLHAHRLAGRPRRRREIPRAAACTASTRSARGRSRRAGPKRRSPTSFRPRSTTCRPPRSFIETLMRGGVDVHSRDGAVHRGRRSTLSGRHPVVLLTSRSGRLPRTCSSAQHYPDLRAHPGRPADPALRHRRLDARVPDGRRRGSRREAVRRARLHSLTPRLEAMAGVVRDERRPARAGARRADRLISAVHANNSAAARRGGCSAATCLMTSSWTAAPSSATRAAHTRRRRAQR